VDTSASWALKIIQTLMVIIMKDSNSDMRCLRIEIQRRQETETEALKAQTLGQTKFLVSASPC
jgi:hypothetical protein